VIERNEGQLRQRRFGDDDDDEPVPPPVGSFREIGLRFVFEHEVFDEIKWKRDRDLLRVMSSED